MSRGLSHSPETLLRKKGYKFTKPFSPVQQPLYNCSTAQSDVLLAGLGCNKGSSDCVLSSFFTLDLASTNWWKMFLSIFSICSSLLVAGPWAPGCCRLSILCIVGMCLVRPETKKYFWCIVFSMRSFHYSAPQILGGN